MKITTTLFTLISILLASFPAYANWETSVSKDEMTGDLSAYASSPITGPTKSMGFPYSDVKAWLGVGCDEKDEWAYIGFTESPNLNDTETKDGYNEIRTRIKWDENVKNIVLTQEWGAKFIHFLFDISAIELIEKSDSVLLELNWHGEGIVYFKFSLSGSSSAINKIRNKCQ